MDAAEDVTDSSAWGLMMAAAQDGDRQAYARLLGEITPVLRRVVRRRWAGSGSADAEDVVQDVLISLHAVRHTYDPARPFMPWLLAIMQYRIQDASRKVVRRSAHERPEWSFEHGLPDVVAEPREDVPGDPEALRKALADLPAGQRRAVELLKLEECSLKEAAAVTGMSVAALKVAVHRGIKALRGKLTGGEP